MDDEKNSSSEASPDSANCPAARLLPPCRVCEERASGFHYGVNTCEACKGFFRRSLRRKDGYRCQDSGACIIGPGKRNSCPQCRYKKCLAVGMSKEAIKTGRYTHEKRTQDIQEIKKLKMDSPPEVIESPSPPSLPPTIMTDCDMENVIYALLHAQREVCPVALLPFLEEDYLHKCQKEYYDEYMVKSDVFGGLAAISKEEYQTFYHTTGIDLDGRQEMMKQCAVNMEEAITRFISFAKAIPGFTDLTLDDQASLIKASRFEFWIFGAFRFINIDLKVMTSFGGNHFHVDEVAKLWEPEFLDNVFEFAVRLKKIGLSFEETAVLRAIAVTFRDRVTLEEPHKVEQIQLNLVSCLQYLLATRYPNDKMRLARYIDRLVAARNLTEYAYKMTSIIQLEWPVLQKHPLLLEIMTV